LDRLFAYVSVMRATQGLAINGNHLPLGDLRHGAHPREKALLELLGIQTGKDPPEGVMGGYAMG
jgi:hypothetical protein